ncbi:hypothetical protein [Adlercreutzia sp. ZJ473]|uniref:hypothetical protein n=1 Tax=Adlercreutzia sp. ZJ473 TaxID=2722822 RepID=UPI0020A65290|nr:hypothetical protein [Adlercreutzia sp. ZJ473]
MAEITIRRSQSQGSAFTEREMLSIGGFALATAVVLASAYSPLLETASTTSPSLHGATHGTMFLFMAAFYLALSRADIRRDKLIRSHTMHWTFLACEVALPCAVLIENMAGLLLAWPFMLVLWALFGTACAYFTCTWIDTLNTLGEELIRRVNLWSFAAAGILTTIVLAIPDEASIIAFIVLCAASCILLPHNAEAQERSEEHDEQWFAENGSFSTNGSYVLFIDGVAIGVFAGLLVARASKDVIPSAAMGIAFICVALTFYVLDKKVPHALSIGRSQLIFLPLMVIGLVLAGFLDSPWNTIIALPFFCPHVSVRLHQLRIALHQRLPAVSVTELLLFQGSLVHGAWAGSRLAYRRIPRHKRRKGRHARHRRIHHPADVRLRDHDHHQTQQVPHRVRRRRQHHIVAGSRSRRANTNPRAC